MISPTGRSVDIAIENGYVGMVDREHFDAFLRRRAVKAGAVLHEGTFTGIERDAEGTHVLYRDRISGNVLRMTGRVVIGADGARSNVARAEVPGGDTIPYVIAYHEIIAAPKWRVTMIPRAATWSMTAGSARISTAGSFRMASRRVWAWARESRGWT